MVQQNPLPFFVMIQVHTVSQNDFSTVGRMAQYTVVMSLSSYVFEAYDDMSDAKAWGVFGYDEQLAYGGYGGTARW